MQLKPGDRIRFLKALECGPTGDHPAFTYADKGDGGWIDKVGGCRESYWVFWDKWPSASFGAELGVDFGLMKKEI